MAFNPRYIAQPKPLVVYAPPDPALFGDWERFPAAERGSAPCRAIPVTEEMRQLDLATQRQPKSTVASAWRSRVLPNRG